METRTDDVESAGEEGSSSTLSHLLSHAQHELERVLPLAQSTSSSLHLPESFVHDVSSMVDRLADLRVSVPSSGSSSDDAMRKEEEEEEEGATNTTKQEVEYVKSNSNEKVSANRLKTSKYLQLEDIHPNMDTFDYGDLSPPTIVVVDTMEQCCQICAEILTNPSCVLGFDCEGVSLGYTGRLCLLQLSTDKNVVYIFDIVADAKMLSPESPLTRILEAPTIVKCIHDCRSDVSALSHQFGITPAGIYDTVIAQQIFLQSYNVSKLSRQIGINRLLQFFGFPEVEEKDAVKKLMRKSFRLWENRPLSDMLLQYAAGDVRYMPAMVRAFESQGVKTSEVIAKTNRIKRKKIEENPLLYLLSLVTEGTLLFNMQSYLVNSQDFFPDLLHVFRIDQHHMEVFPDDRLWYLRILRDVVKKLHMNDISIPLIIRKFLVGKFGAIDRPCPASRKSTFLRFASMAVLFRTVSGSPAWTSEQVDEVISAIAHRFSSDTRMNFQRDPSTVGTNLTELILGDKVWSETLPTFSEAQRTVLSRCLVERLVLVRGPASSGKSSLVASAIAIMIVQRRVDSLLEIENYEMSLSCKSNSSNSLSFLDDDEVGEAALNGSNDLDDPSEEVDYESFKSGTYPSSEYESVYSGEINGEALSQRGSIPDSFDSSSCSSTSSKRKKRQKPAGRRGLIRKPPDSFRSTIFVVSLCEETVEKEYETFRSQCPWIQSIRISSLCAKDFHDSEIHAGKTHYRCSPAMFDKLSPVLEMDDTVVFCTVTFLVGVGCRKLPWTYGHLILLDAETINLPLFYALILSIRGFTQSMLVANVHASPHALQLRGLVGCPPEVISCNDTGALEWMTPAFLFFQKYRVRVVDLIPWSHVVEREEVLREMELYTENLKHAQSRFQQLEQSDQIASSFHSGPVHPFYPHMHTFGNPLPIAHGYQPLHFTYPSVVYPTPQGFGQPIPFYYPFPVPVAPFPPPMTFPVPPSVTYGGLVNDTFAQSDDSLPVSSAPSRSDDQ